MNYKTLYFYLLFFFIVNVFYAQEHKKSIELHWNDKSKIESSYTSGNIITPLLNNGLFDDYFLPIYTEQWAVNNNLKVRDYKVLNVKYAIVNPSIFYEKETKNFPKSIKSNFSIKKARNKSFAQFIISPLVYNDGVLKKIISFDLKYELAVATKNRNFLTYHDSPLASGDWYKFAIDTTGVFKLDKSFLKGLGVPINSINPKNIQVFGNGGALLPEANSIFRYDGLQENAIFVSGEEDNSFDTNDYILFYGVGSDSWEHNILELKASHRKNIYSDQAYYYIHVGNEFGKRITNQTPIESTPDISITTFNDFAVHELEKYNIDYFGQLFLGENFSVNDTQNFSFNFTDVDLTKNIAVKLSAATVADATSYFILNYNSQEIINLGIGQIPVNSVGNVGRKTASVTAISDILDFELHYDNMGKPSARGYLDYIEINGIKKLVARDKQFSFRSYNLTNTNDVGEFIIENKNNIKQVWEVTNKLNPQIIENKSSDDNFAFLSQGGSLQEYVLLNENDYYSPIRLRHSKITNQNLHGLQDVDYLIITTDELLDEANRLANYHTSKGLSTFVTTEKLIYNEFSSGSKDPVGIRDFIKYLYHNASSEDKKIKYVLMFGDTSFDFKDIEGNNKDNINLIAYQSRNSISLATSYVTDDFFVMLDDNEGDFYNHNGSGDLIDVAIGRMPVKNIEEAVVAVNKTLNYYSEKAFGKWRNSISFIADDSDKPGEQVFLEKEEVIADRIKQYKPAYNINKIYADAYVQQLSSGGESYPQVKEVIDNSIEKGTLILNYFGHGGENGLGHESYIDLNQIDAWNNYNTLPLFITVTCEFSRYDNPTRIAGGEKALSNPHGGSINMITTSREVYIGSGASFNVQLFEDVIEYHTDDNLTIAQSLVRTKNRNASYAQRLFISFFGDPAMHLSKPKPKVKLTHMNDVDISQDLDTIKALSHVYFKGIVTDKNNNLLPDFNGDLSITVYDKITMRQTLNNDGESDIIDFDVRDSKIFNGKATVENGEWQFDFIAPRDIRIAYGEAKLSFYADNKIIDKNGYNTDVIIGGINYDAPEDNIGPKIKLYMNDESFIDGGNTNESPLFLAVLEDDSGINTSFTAVDHDIVAILDGDQSNPIIMNDYFETESNNFQKGKVNYPFRNLTVGLHTLTFKCWDTYNNPSEASLSFVVVSDSELVLDHVLNYPNPFINYTEFWFTHNKPNEALEVQVQIFTVSGKLIKTINQQVLTNGTLSRTMTWNGLDDFGNKIGKGVYIYKLKVKVTSSGLKSEKIEKLVILQ
jgi:hypothetical protein